jgi:hypothetical protein
MMDDNSEDSLPSLIIPALTVISSAESPTL